MKATTLLAIQMKDAFSLLDNTLADVAGEHIHKAPSGKVGHVGANFAHIAAGTDYAVNKMLQGKPMLAETTFKDKTGTDTPYPPYDKPAEIEQWMRTVKVDLTALRAYWEAVKKCTDEYVSSLSDDEIERTIELGPLGKQSVAYAFSGFVIGHTLTHAGEISAIKGMHGAKGYPF